MSDIVAARSARRSDLRAWDALRSPGARLVWLSLSPDLKAAAPPRADVLDMTGFGDGTFALLARFAAGLLGPDPWWGELNGM